MNRKFSIAKAVDLDRLDNEINMYIQKTGEANPYIFMNNETINSIAYGIDYKLSPIFKSNETMAYCGYKVFNDNTLKFGEVEIR